MSTKVLLFVFVACGYVIFSALGLDVQSKVDGSSSDTSALDKRDLNVEATHAKFLDPPAEYYRGPGSSSSSYSYSERDRNRDRDGLVIGLQRPPYGGSGYGYDTRYSTSGGAGRPGSGNRYGSQDRIGYGSSSTGTGYNSYGGSGTSFGSPSSTIHPPYGQPQPIDFSSTGSGSSYGHYPSGQAGGGYSGSGQDWFNKGSYPGAGNFFPPASSNDFYYPGKSDFAKSLLLPLAGAAILGLTAALVANPSLLHLGTLSGKRRRRAAFENRDQDEKDEQAQKIAYKAQRGKLI